MFLTKSISRFVDDTLIDLGRQFRWSYLPPLMVYVAAGITQSWKLKVTKFYQE